MRARQGEGGLAIASWRRVLLVFCGWWRRVYLVLRHLDVGGVGPLEVCMHGRI